MSLRSTGIRTAIAVAVVVCAGAPALAQRIDCTQAAFEQAIANANSAGGNRTITFNCSSQTILLDSARSDSRNITAPNVVIDGETRGIVFQMNPPWWDDRLDACGGSNCDPDGDNVPNACADLEGASRFLRLEANGIVVRNIAFNYFWDGIQMGRNGASQQTLENVSCNNPGDDCVSNPTNSGDRLTVRGSLFTNACDKAIQMYGRDITTTTTNDWTIETTTFTNCVQPMHAPYAGGRFVIRGNTFQDVNATGIFACTGPRFDGSVSMTYFSDNVIDRCRRGLRVGGSVHLQSKDNTYRNNGLRGAAVYGSARASFEGDTFENNGGETSSEAYYGGISVGGTASVDAGGGALTLDGQVRPSLGNNTFRGNRSSSDSTLDVQNVSTVQVKAENNWWGDGDPSNQVSGSVDFTPFLSGPPGGTDTTPPAPVSQLRRTDRI